MISSVALRSGRCEYRYRRSVSGGLDDDRGVCTARRLSSCDDVEVGEPVLGFKCTKLLRKFLPCTSTTYERERGVLKPSPGSIALTCPVLIEQRLVNLFPGLVGNVSFYHIVILSSNDVFQYLLGRFLLFSRVN